MRWQTVKSIKSGKALWDVEAVKKRLREIEDRPKSKYFKYLKAGYVEVHYDPGRQSRGRYDIVVSMPLEPHGMIECGNCEMRYFPLQEDYLCPDCRAGLGKEEG